MSAAPASPAPAPAPPRAAPVVADSTATLAGRKDPPKSFVRRDRLVALEREVQARWAAARETEADAPRAGERAPPGGKFLVTFPYPYMNGRLHLGHAFSLTKAEFAARFQSLVGRHVLFPFAFHCTGMPIQAAANRLRREYEAGVPDAVLARLAAGDAGEADDVGGAAGGGDEGEDEGAAAAAVAAPGATDGADGAPAGAAAAAAAPAPDAGAAAGPVGGAAKELGKFSGKKSKVVAKGGAAGLSQFEILLKSGLAPADIPAFTDPRHWLTYFPPLGEADLRAFGLAADWRRSFITTDANPFYDSFIRWQFNTLKARGKVGFGTRPTVFSPLDGQACADHDRASGEGVGPQEYTLIKIRLLEVPAGHPAAAGPLPGLLAEGRPVFFVAATLRPETMYGQTNLFLLPEGEYGAFAMTGPGAGHGGRAVFICSERSARNMAHQGFFAAPGVVERAAPGGLLGEALLGLPCAAPYAAFPAVYTLPLLTISMKKGTGVVTSVPSDAPDDFAALRDLRDKPKLREKFGLPDAAVLPYAPVPIIDVPGWGRTSAVEACERLKIKSQNDREKLAEAKDAVYMAGFYQGTLLVGKYAGRRVADAKPLVKADLVAEGHAAVYHEPESLVTSRSGDECVVAHVDQWFLRYGAPEWRGVVEAWIRSGRFATYNAQTADAFEHVVGWLTEWACSRSFGLGTRLPWDPQFVIESLSDSTIYMAYYTVAHLLHGGSYDGAGGAPGPAGVPAAALTDAVWDYVFLGAPFPADAAVPEAAVAPLRAEFTYWYPVDLRVSGKDLIGNHLTMSLYNHAAVFLDHLAPAVAAAVGPPSEASGATSLAGAGAEARAAGGAPAAPAPAPARAALPPALADALAARMPGGFYCNGHVQVDGKKMSKSLGNFILLHEAVARWSTDGTRFALADAGDGLEDANFERDGADNAVLRLTTEEEYARDMVAAAAAGELRTGDKSFADKVFDSRMSLLVREARAAYEAMKFREALKCGFFDLQAARDAYRDMCDKLGTPPHAGCVRAFLETQAVVVAPIVPHWADAVWGGVLGGWARAPGPDGRPPSVLRAGWPELPPPDEALLETDRYLSAKLHEFRLTLMRVAGVKAAKVAKGAPPPPKPADVSIFVAAGWPAWQRKPLELLRALWDPAAHAATGGFPEDALKRVQDAASKDAELKPFLKKIMPLASVTIAAMRGRAAPTPALALRLPFDERAVWADNGEYVRKALEVPGVVRVFVTDDARLAPGSATAKALDPNNRCKEVTPGEPEVWPYGTPEEVEAAAAAAAATA